MEEVEVLDSKKSENNQSFFLISLLTELGFSIALPITIGALAGSWLDQRFGTSPKLTLSLLMVGVMMSAINLYQIIKLTSKKGK